MRNLVLLSMVLGIAFVSCAAKEKVQKTKVENNSLLWKITGGDLEKPSYLFGTIHLICPDDYFWDEGMQGALDASEKVVFEMDMDDPTLQMKVAGGMMMEDGRSIKDYFNEEDYMEFSDFFTAQMGLPIVMLEKMKPMALLSLVSMKTLDCETPVSYEGNIMELATKDNKEILGLESAEDQLAVFNSMNVDSSARQLLRAIKEWQTMKTQYSQMIQFYKNQDLIGLNNLILESPDFKDNLDVLLYDRNKKWIPKIEKMIEKHPSFIAVGAGHLLGESGVIQLLRAKGYTVEMVN